MVSCQGCAIGVEELETVDEFPSSWPNQILAYAFASLFLRFAPVVSPYIRMNVASHSLSLSRSAVGGEFWRLVGQSGEIPPIVLPTNTTLLSPSDKR